MLFSSKLLVKKKALLSSGVCLTLAVIVSTASADWGPGTFGSAVDSGKLSPTPAWLRAGPRAHAGRPGPLPGALYASHNGASTCDSSLRLS